MVETRRSSTKRLRLLCVSALLAATIVLAGCGPTEETTADEDPLTAVRVAERLRAAGAPITGPITDTTFVSRWADYPGVTSDAETATKRLDLTIEVYATVLDRRQASKQQDENLASTTQYSSVKAGCGRILVSGILTSSAVRSAARRDFAKVEKALDATFGPC